MANADAISRVVSEDLEAVFAGAAQSPMLSTPTPTPTIARPLPLRGQSKMRYAGALAAAVLTGVTVGSLIQHKPAGSETVGAPTATPPRPIKATPAAQLRGPTTVSAPVVEPVTEPVAEPPAARPGLVTIVQKPSRIAAPPPAARRPVARLTPIVAKAPAASFAVPRPMAQIQPLPLPAPPTRLQPAAVPNPAESGCQVGPDCGDEQLMAAEADLREAYQAARRAGVPPQVLRYDQARWAETREAAASRSRRALLGAYRAHTSDLFDSADSALSGSADARPDEAGR
jgi:uncharacterized protein YecT (DUF1311 family)